MSASSDKLNDARLRAINSGVGGGTAELAQHLGIDTAGRKSLTKADYRKFYDSRPDLQNAWNGGWPSDKKARQFRGPTANAYQRHNWEEEVLPQLKGGIAKKGNLEGFLKDIHVESPENECRKDGMGGKANSPEGFACWAVWNEANGGKTNFGTLKPTGFNVTKEEIYAKLEDYPLTKEEKRSLMMSRWGDVGFNTFNKYLDNTRLGFGALFGKRMTDATAAQWLSQNPESFNGLIQALQAKSKNEDYTLDGINIEGLIDSDGEYTIDSSSMDEYEKFTVPYDFDKDSRFYGTTEVSNGKRVETEKYWTAVDAPGWYEDPLLGTMVRGPNGWDYNSAMGTWLYQSPKNPSWYYSNDSQSWVWPTISENIDGLVFYSVPGGEEPEGWLYPDFNDGRGKYFDFNTDEWVTGDQLAGYDVDPETGIAKQSTPTPYTVSRDAISGDFEVQFGSQVIDSGLDFNEAHKMALELSADKYGVAKDSTPEVNFKSGVESTHPNDELGLLEGWDINTKRRGWNYISEITGPDGSSELFMGTDRNQVIREAKDWAVLQSTPHVPSQDQVDKNITIDDQKQTQLDYKNQELLDIEQNLFGNGLSGQGRTAEEVEAYYGNNIEDIENIENPTENPSSNGNPSDGGVEPGGDIAKRISYDYQGFSYEDVAGDLATKRNKLDEIARDLRYEGFTDKGIIMGLLSKTEVYKDFMDSWTNEDDKAEARVLMDEIVESVAEANAQKHNVAGSLDMFDSSGAGMLDPRMTLDQKRKIRSAKPSRLSTQADVDAGLATSVGEVIDNPEYDPNLSGYFEHRNPRTGELETRAYRPDMPGKLPFAAIQEGLIDRSTMTMEDHMSDLFDPVGDTGKSKWRNAFDKQVTALKDDNIMAGGLDDPTTDADESLGLYSNEGTAALNYVYGDDENSLKGKTDDYYDVKSHLLNQRNYLDRMDTQRDLDNSSKVRAAIGDLDPVERARDRSTDRIRLARFGGEVNADLGGISGAGGLYESQLDPDMAFKNLDNVTGLGDTYTQDEIDMANISQGLRGLPKASSGIKQNQYYNNINPIKTF